MQRSSFINNYWEKLLPNLLILGGAGIIGIALAGDFLGIGGLPGVGINQISLALSGVTVLLTGTVLILSMTRRYIGEWLLVGTGGVVVAAAADLPILGGLPGFGIKQIMLVSVVLGFLLVGATSMRQQYTNEWLNLLAANKLNVAKFLSVAVQLGLLVLLIQQFELENQAVYNNILPLTFYGFLVHYFLPFRYRLSFFLILSLVAIAGIFGVFNGAWLIGIGLGLIAICHLPIPYSARVVVLLAVGAVLALLRAEWFQAPWPGLIWPILGSMFMFRLIIYLYDLKHSKVTPTLSSTLSYFFLLPNIVFPFFPVVDYSTFRRTYYDTERYRIYQKGVEWMFRGVVHLVLYRFVNYYLMLAPQDVTNVSELVQFSIANFSLYLRVSGQFHLIIGILHLFGFNLPETHHLYFLASSFTDLWRRINIYWKDFMLKIFYYPTYFKVRQWGATTSLVLATLFVFVLTWFFHAYQWFWLRGSFLLTLPDILFWTILTLLVVANTLYDTKRGSKHTLGKRTWSLGDFTSLTLRTAGTFSIMTILWSLWSSESISDWVSLWSVAGTLQGLVGLLLTFLSIVVIFGTFIWFKTRTKENTTSAQSKPPTFFKSVAVNGAFILLIFLFGNPVVYTYLFNGKTQEVVADLTTSRLSDREAELLQRGYYEDIIGVNKFNADLWEVYSQRPTDWPLIQDTEAARMTKDFLLMELVPSTSLVFHGSQFTTNSWGMRDQEYAQIPPPNTYRIVLLGPSFVMGSGVADDQTFEALLENRLNRQGDGESATRYEILNFGVSGHSALQELLILEDRALSFKPDAVFFVAHQLEEKIVVRNLANRFVTGVDIPYDYLNEIARKAGIDENTSFTDAERRLQPFGAEILSWTYNRVAQTSREQGITPVWIFMPTLETPFSEEDVAYLTHFAEEAGFITVNLADIYKNKDVDSLVVAEWDRHPNAKGHKLIADYLYEALWEKEKSVSLGISN